MKSVKFITHYSIYFPGEVATFPAAEADSLVRRRAAVAVEPSAMDNASAIPLGGQPENATAQKDEKADQEKGETATQTKDEKATVAPAKGKQASK